MVCTRGGGTQGASGGTHIASRGTEGRGTITIGRGSDGASRGTHNIGRGLDGAGRGTHNFGRGTQGASRRPHGSPTIHTQRHGGVSMPTTSVPSFLEVYDGFDDSDDFVLESSHDLQASNVVHASNAMAQAPILPPNREWLEVIANQFVSTNAPREITDILKNMFDGPWISWKHIPRDSRRRLFNRFKKTFQWDSEAEVSVLKAWEATMKKRVKDILCSKRKKAIAKARKKGLNVDVDLSVIIPYCPSWIKEEHWVQMVEMWNTPKWKALSEVNQKNKNTLLDGSLGKYTTGTVSFLVTKLRREKAAGRALPWSDHFLNFHITKSSWEAVAKGTGEPVFVNSSSKRVRNIRRV